MNHNSVPPADFVRPQPTRADPRDRHVMLLVGSALGFCSGAALLSVPVLNRQILSTRGFNGSTKSQPRTRLVDLRWERDRSPAQIDLIYIF